MSFDEILALEPAVTAPRVADLVGAHPGLFGFDPTADRFDVRFLGQGESYRAWLLEDLAGEGAGSFVLRVARRPADEMPRPIVEEFAALGQIPPDVGPRPIHLEVRPATLGAPYMVTTFVPGRVIPADRWTTELLVAHARQLAALHERPYSFRGALTTPPEQRSTSLSLVERLDEALSWWATARPDIVAEPELARLLPRVERFVARSVPAFSELRRFALVHGDLVVPNILVDARGQPRYVDWEWAEIGDPAQDLALIGGAVPADPWYCSLTATQTRLLIDSYVDSAHGRALETPQALEIRRAAWEVFERCTSSLYCRSLRGTPQDVATEGRYSKAATALTAGLNALV